MNQPPNRIVSDVIAAIATPAGRGGIGIVRLSGPGLAEIARSLIGHLPPPRLATHTLFLGGDAAAIDDGIALYFPAPASYTGEDVLELQGHGGPVVMQMLLRRCLDLGARAAAPGEFTRRAFLNDKLDLAQAEGVADLIEAATETAARSALRSLRGEFSAAINALVQQLIELRMLVEAMLDFPEEEIDSVDLQQAQRRLQQLSAALHSALARARQGSILRTGLQVVLAGRPNVGKSSLLNRLAGEDLAIVTPIAGTTRDAVRQSIQVEGVPINIIDTAGLRQTSDEVETIGIERTWEAIARADLLLLVVAAGVGVTPEDETMLARMPPSLRRLLLHNKCDLVDAAGRASPGPGEGSVRVSAKTGEGIAELKRELLAAAGWQPGNEDSLMARERHVAALRDAAACLDRSAQVLAQPELFAEELRLAQESLASITGKFSADDLLGEIFSRFCIGK